MFETIQRCWSQWLARRHFRRALALVSVGVSQAGVGRYLGGPDLVRGEDPQAGTDSNWEYHERLSDHQDVVIGFAGGLVCFSSLRKVPDPELRDRLRRGNA